MLSLFSTCREDMQITGQSYWGHRPTYSGANTVAVSCKATGAAKGLHGARELWFPYRMGLLGSVPAQLLVQNQ